jgi:hypothetical protein
MQSSSKSTDAQLMHQLLSSGWLNDIIGQIDEKLGKAAFGGCIVAKHGGKGSITKGFWKALTESFAGAGVVA